MQFLDKKDFLNNQHMFENIVIDIGCGSRKRQAGAIGIDMIDYPCVDIVGDALEILRKIDSNSVDEVCSYHFIEHVENFTSILLEIDRILKVNGVVNLVAPHFSNPYYYSDPTHKSFFGLYTLCYFVTNKYFNRNVLNYNVTTNLALVKVDLIFKSAPPFYFRHVLKLAFGKFFNSCKYMKEFYEENICYLFPCYEVSYVLLKSAD